MGKTLEFGALPLVEVRIRVTFQPRPPISTTEFVELVKKLDFEVVWTNPPFQFSLPVQFQIPSVCNTFYDGMVADFVWDSSIGEYPRFEKLLETVNRFIRLLQLPTHVVSLTYVVIEPEIRPVYDSLLEWMKLQIALPAKYEQIHRISINGRVAIGSGTDFSVEVARTPDDKVALVTSAGMFTDDYNEGLQQVHTLLISSFRDLITEKAEQQWKLES